MIRIAICDDEKHMSDHIRSFVSDFFRKKNREISLRMFSSGEELLSYSGQIDILFLDIQMKDMDGMETARKLRANQYRGFLVFITVLKEMVFQSFEVQTYDYLVKPVDKNQFEKTMERLYASMQNASEDSLMVQKGHEGRIIAKDQIIFCEIIDRKIYLNLTSGEVVDYYVLPVLFSNKDSEKETMAPVFFPVRSMRGDCHWLSFSWHGDWLRGACVSSYGMWDSGLPCGF